MQLKWLEDFMALAQARSFSRAAELRHVTHPAFGRRIKALEDWAGTALLERGASPLRLTPAGESLLHHARQTVQGLALAREDVQGAMQRTDRSVTLATGRTLARTMVADLLVRLKPVLADGELRIRTRALAETTLMLERGEADFMLTYHHPLLAVQLSGRQYSHFTLAKDRLVAVTRRHAQGRLAFQVDGARPVPYLAYASTLALGRLLDDHLANHPQTPALRRVVECDSADALLEYALRGVGVAWLPWSLAAAACKAGQLATLAEPQLSVAFEVRLYRAKRRLSAMAEAVWQAIALA